jgi:hypothetical protein
MKRLAILAFAVVAIALASGCCCCRGLFNPPATFAAAPVVQQPACNTCNTCPTPVTYGYGAAPACSSCPSTGYAPASYGYDAAPTYDYGTTQPYAAPAAYSTPSYGASSSCPNCAP